MKKIESITIEDNEEYLRQISKEVDHLDGILHIDIAEEVYQMPAEERKAWRINHGYKVYSKTGDYEVLRKENSKKKVLIKK